MARIDKIKLKSNKNNIVDFEIEQLSNKKFNVEEEYKKNNWVLKFNNKKNRDINLLSLFNNQKIKKDNTFALEIKYFFYETKKINNPSNMLSGYNALRHFILKFLNDEKIIITSFKDIDYNVLLKYSEYIRLKSKYSHRSYKKILRILNEIKIKNYFEISEDVKNKNYPNIKFTKESKQKIEYYEEEDFIELSNLVKNILKSSFKEVDNKEHVIIKAAYWYLAMFTGFNQTGLNYLDIESFEFNKEKNKKFVYISCKKNRSYKGKQTMLIPLTEETYLLEKTIKYLIENRKKINSNSLNIFSYKKDNQIFEYLGAPSNFQNLFVVKEYLKNNNIKNIKTLSTMKIRKFFSNKMFDKTNSENLVSKILGHKNVKTTEKFYIKKNINKELQFKFNIVQNLINKFSNNNNFNDWVIFQKSFNIENYTLEEIYNKLNNGYFDTAIGKCIKDELYNEEKCKSYINCLSCKNYSVVGVNDIWKLLSFKNAIEKEHKNENKINWVIELINNTIIEFDIEIIQEAKNKINNYGFYPFWKNELMANAIIKEYIENE